jgi:hypothetical protein
MKKISGKMQFVGCFLLNAMKNEENFGKNAICWMFLVECDEKCKKISEKNAFCWMFLVERDEK